MHRFTNSKMDKAYQYVDFILDNKLVSKLERVTDESLNGKIGHNEIVFEDEKN